MSVETREINGKIYVTRTRRVGKKIVKEHLGKPSDPTIAFYLRSSRLAASARAASLAGLRSERLASRSIEESMDLLVLLASCCPVLALLIDRDHGTEILNLKDATTTGEPLEGLLRGVFSASEFRRLCQLADQGDTQAQAHLNKLAKALPEVLQSAFDPIQAARKQVIDSIAGNSYLARKAVEARIDHQLKQVRESIGDDPVSAMLSDITVLAWLDACRCGVAASRDMEYQRDRVRAQALADRSLRRFERITRALQEYRDQQHDGPE